MASSQLAAPSTVYSVERRAQAAALRARGLTYVRVGQLMRISRQSAYKLVQSALADRRLELDESIDEIRAIEIDRYDTLTRLMFKRLDDPTNPDPERTVTVILKISERRSKLLGLDAPTQFGFTPGGSNVVSNAGDIDVGKLSVDQLRELETIQSRYDALRAIAAPVQLPAGEPVTVVPAPTEGGDHDQGIEQPRAS